MACITSDKKPLSFADKRLLSSDLLHISRILEEEAWQLAKQPPTWQILAHALNWPLAPWFAPLPATSKSWVPVFREGASGKMSYNSARDKLIRLYNQRLSSDRADPSKPILDGAQFLCEHFTAGSLRDLHAFALFWYGAISRRKNEAWWDHLPIFQPLQSVNTAVRFIDWSKSKQRDNTANYSVRVVSYFSDSILQKVEEKR